jgi:hypothetical protein
MPTSDHLRKPSVRFTYPNLLLGRFHCEWNAIYQTELPFFTEPTVTNQIARLIKEWGCIRRFKSPALRTKILNFQNPQKSVLLWKMSSRLSQLHHHRFLYLNFIMLWLIMCVKNGSFIMLMEIRYTFIFEYEWVSSPFFLKQEIWHTEVTLSFKHFSRMETWPTHIEKLMFNISLFFQNWLYQNVWFLHTLYNNSSQEIKA